jgi:23S rRNA (guanosine2251-2'-O)-methyltransferase
MSGKVSSLNVSAAGAVVLFEAARQRRGAEQARPAVPQTQPAAPAKPKKQKGLGS